MPGAMEHVEGEVHAVRVNGQPTYWDVKGLQDIFDKFAGQKVSITVEEAD